VTTEELIEKFIKENERQDIYGRPTVPELLRKAIDFGYMLAVSEGAGRTSN
jgi:hypothetical protein